MFIKLNLNNIVQTYFFFTVLFEGLYFFTSLAEQYVLKATRCWVCDVSSMRLLFTICHQKYCVRYWTLKLHLVNESPITQEKHNAIIEA